MLDGASGSSRTRVKYAYQRPIFLQLFSEDEIQVTADHSVRPIIVPRDIGILPWFSGYAEAINAGKSARNEDQVIYCFYVCCVLDCTSCICNDSHLC